MKLTVRVHRVTHHPLATGSGRVRVAALLVGNGEELVQLDDMGPQRLDSILAACGIEEDWRTTQAAGTGVPPRAKHVRPVKITFVPRNCYEDAGPGSALSIHGHFKLRTPDDPYISVRLAPKVLDKLLSAMGVKPDWRRHFKSDIPVEGDA